MKLLICYNKYSGHNKISLDKIIKDLSNTFDVDYFIPDINLNIKDYIINNSNKYDILLIVGKGNEQFLNKGLGKEFYNGDKFYGKRYLEKRRREEI